ncbi:hypothetical protein C6P46_001720 [Rhodotorula mucilaginosa]|uniref:Uncharacterized protein n=1 Tax=Rhodotorula mucilaginosa TaxID=5537 RepID=A0A9P6W6X0_RHOMI|nr:hypothetical protein C6P46_001720 [Rhodotorula mucilaginosa]
MPVPIAVGVLVGVAASFIQSLGLTLQRLSHLSNEQRSTPDWQRPLWLVGLAIFLLSNVTGTLFQISTLPLVVLGPLGAVSLVCNALFAHLLLGDAFSLQLAFGSALIAAGATLVGIFGAVPEQSHTLPQLVALYQRPPFLAWLALLAVALALVLTLSHLVEWRLARTLASLPAAPKSPRSSANRRHRLTARTRTRRRWSLPNSSLRRPSDATTGAESSGGGEREPLLGPRAHQNQTCSSSSSSKRTRFSDRIDPIRPRALRLPPPPSTVHPPQSASTVKDDDDEGGNNGEQSSAPAAAAAAVDGILAAAERTRLWLAIAYGATSGTLSGLCLLFTKTGMDLVIQTLVHRNNQFGHFGAWALLIVLLLSYLNRALRLAGPTLVCPTAFCFYNAASILSGLIFYRQFDALRPVQGFLIALGSGVLLGGVWIVSVKPPTAPPAESTEGISETRRDKMGAVGLRREDDYADAGSGLSMDEMMGDEDSFFDSEEDDEDADDLIPYRPRGFSIGISAASPGFEIRPSAAPRRNRLSLDGTTISQRNELFPHGGRSTSSLTPPPPPSSSRVDQSRTDLRDSFFTKSPPCAEEVDGAQQPPSHRRNRRTAHHHHRRDDSLTGLPYVGPPPHSYVINLSTEHTLSHDGDSNDDGLGAAPEGQFARDGRWWWWQRWFRSQPRPAPS